MAALDFECPHCNQELDVKEDLFGSTINCPTCHKAIKLPGQQSVKESFSSVVLKVIPEKGTLGQMLADVGQMKPLSTNQSKVMKDAVKWGRDPGKSRSRWTSLSRFLAHPESRATWELPKPRALEGDAFFDNPDWRYEINSRI